MAKRDDFTDEEWAALVRAPVVAGMAISIADPGGPIEALKETSAVVKFATSTDSEGRPDVVGEVARDLRAHFEQHKNPMGDFKPDKGAMVGKEILDELSRAHQLVKAKGSPEEAQAFADWIRESAQRAADAAKEGGFMGWHAERVSQGEKDMLEQIDKALA
jgi:hypothetical protein